MYILGINFGHDAAAVLMHNGFILNAIEEEKMSRRKQDFGWPAQAVATILQQNGLQPKDIDVVAFGSCHYNDLGRNEIRYRFKKSKWHRALEIVSRVLAYYRLIPTQISLSNQAVFTKRLRILGFSKASVEFYNHHLSHAASACFSAPFLPDLVITADGYGDEEAFNFYRPATDHTLEKIRANSYQYSVGQFYSTVTWLLGFRPNRHEGKITGLAAFGKPSALLDVFRKLFFYDAEGNLRRMPGEDLDDWWRTYGLDQRMNWRTRVNLHAESVEGAHYGRNAHALRAWMEHMTKGYSKEDIAYACQSVTEEVVLEETRRVLQQYFPNQKVKIALAGGVFANVRVNQKLTEMPEIDNVFVQPAMGDSGLAMGAVFLANQALNPSADVTNYAFRHTYHGPDFGPELALFIKKIPVGFTVLKMEQPAREIAQLLFENKIIGFWHGPMEWGPRALGHRSILLNTFDRTVNDTLNQRLNRTEFMPFAPSVIDRAAKKYFPKYAAHHCAAEYMTITYDTDPQYHERLQAVTHVDGTARPQIVQHHTNPYYHDILASFEELSGCGAIVNTSFNVHEEPIVSTPEVAFKALQQNRVDYLVLEEYLISRV